MSAQQVALVEAEMLTWARNATRTPIEDAAKAAYVSKEKVTAWENGEAKPTIRQLRLLANKYKIPFATFYLPSPPLLRLPRYRDYRGPVLSIPNEDYLLIQEIRRAVDASQIATELQSAEEKSQTAIPEIEFGRIAVDDAAAIIRGFLHLHIDEQIAWRDTRSSFNSIRNKTEDAGIFVFQSSKISIDQFRALAISDVSIPVIILNRKDALAGRIFSILHEIVHLCLRNSGICNLDPDHVQDKHDRSIEVFCNAVAAEALIPKRDLASQQIVKAHQGYEWNDSELRSLSKRYGSSREAVLRTLLGMGLTTKWFYESERERFAEEYTIYSKKNSGRIPRAMDMLSQYGSRYLSTLVRALDNGQITTTDFSDYSNLRLKHLDRLRTYL